MEETLDNLSCDKNTATNILPDIHTLDQHRREIDRLNQQVSNLKILIGAKGKLSTLPPFAPSPSFPPPPTHKKIMYKVLLMVLEISAYFCCPFLHIMLW